MSISDITKPAIHRMILKINNQISVNNLVYEEIRYMLLEYLKNVLKECITIVEYCNKKTVSSKYVYPCLSNIPASVSKNTKKCSVSKKDKDFCFDLPKEAFKRLVREIGNKFLLNIRFSDEAFYLLQMDTEHHLMKIFKNAVSIAIHSKRNTLFPKDIQFANNNQSNNTKKINLTNFVSFTGIEKILKNFNPKLKLTENGNTQLNTLLNIIAQTILNKSDELMNIKGDVKHIDEIEIKTAVKLILNGELYKHAIHNANTNANKNQKLLLSVEYMDFTDKSIYYLTSILEYIITEIFDLSVDSSKNNILSTKNIKDAIDKDEELLQLTKDLHIWFVDN
jgi:histone H3